MIRPSEMTVTLAAKCILMELLTEAALVTGTHLLHLAQLSPRVLVVPKILLIPHEDYRNVRAEVLHLGRPLFRDVLCKMMHTKLMFIQL